MTAIAPARKIHPRQQDRNIIVAQAEALGAEFVAQSNTCHCFHHKPDKNPSAGILLGNDGVWRYQCMKPGCLDKSMDTFDLEAYATGRPLGDILKSHNDAVSTPKRQPCSIFDNLERVYVWLHNKHGGQLERLHEYFDASGEHIQYVIRWRIGPSDKTIRPAVLHNGKVELRFPENRVLYNLLNVQFETSIVVTEGELKVEYLDRYGITATTSAGGGLAADKTDWQPLAGKNVIIWPDCDEAGERYADDVTSILTNLKPPANVLRINPTEFGLQEAEDAVNYIDKLKGQGYSETQIKESLNTVLSSAKPSVVKPKETSVPVKNHNEQSGIVSVCLDDVQIEDVEWLWPNVIPAEELTLLVGNGAAGKTTMSSYIMSRVSTGTHFYGGMNTVGAKNIIFLGNEDSISKQLKPKLVANGADCKRVHAVNYVQLAGDGLRHTFSIKNHLHHLIDLIDNIGDVGLIVIDPITQFLGNVHENANSEVRTVLDPLTGLLRERGITCIGISHLNKKSDIQSAYRILGSIAFVAAARSVWLVAAEKDKDDSTAEPSRYFMPIKCNYSINPMALTFRIQERGEIVFDGESDRHPDDVLSGGHTPTAKNEAKDWLESFIGTDAVPAADVVAAGEKKGFSQATIQRAATDLGITKRRSVMHNNKYVWSLER